MSLILTKQNSQARASQPKTRQTENQELLDLSINQVTHAARKINGVENMRQLTMNDLQAMALDLRLALEALHLLKRRNNNDE